MAVLLAAAYALPIFGLVLPTPVSISIFLLCIPLGIVGMIKVLTFHDYRGINQELLSGLTNQMDSAAKTKVAKQTSEKDVYKRQAPGIFPPNSLHFCTNSGRTVDAP